MAAPWEKYQSTPAPSDTTSGPWAKYGSSPSTAPAAPAATPPASPDLSAPSPGSEIGGGFWDTVKSGAAGMAKALFNPMGAGEDMGQAMVEQAKKAKEAYQQGRYSEMAGHGLAAALPGVGPFAASVGETLGGNPAMPPGKQTTLEGPPSPPRPYRALGMAAGGALLSRAGDAVPPVVRGATNAQRAMVQGVKGTVAKPGFGDIAYGTGNAAIGAGAMMSGNPFAMIYGGGHAMRGIGSIIRGIAKNKAAAVESGTPPVADSPMQPVTTNPMSRQMMTSATPIAPALPSTAPMAGGYAPLSPSMVPSGSVRTPPSAPTPPTAPSTSSAPTSAPATSSSTAATAVNPVHAQYRSALAGDAADILHSSGIPAADLKYMGDEHWNQLAQAIDQRRGTPKGESRVGPFSDDTKAEIEQTLRRMERLPAGTVSVAQQLRDAMKQ